MKEYAQKIASVTKDSFPSAQLSTDFLWVLNEEQYFLHKHEIEQTKEFFEKGRVFFYFYFFYFFLFD